MSDKTLKKEQKKAFPQIFKWVGLVLLIIVLEIGGIALSVKITKSQKNSENYAINDVLEMMDFQAQKIKKLEKLPLTISENTQQITNLSNTLNLLSDNFNQLNQEVGNKKLQKLDKKVNTLRQKIEVMKETQGSDSLVLSVALFIKENALYHRNFSYEADILQNLAIDNTEIKDDVAQIQKFKDIQLADNEELVKKFAEIAQDYQFNADEEQTETSHKDTALSKGVKLLKNTMSNINLNKVMVLKKKQKTQYQKQLLEDLTLLVNTHNFAKALEYINTHPEFGEQENNNFTSWQKDVENRLAFDNALKNIISKQLEVFRKELKENQNKAEPTEENSSNEETEEQTSEPEQSKEDADKKIKDENLKEEKTSIEEEANND